MDRDAAQRSRLVTPQTSRRSLFSACLAHVLHDGYTDLLYPLLPIWQVELGLTYSGLAALRALYYGTMGGLQVPVDRWAGRLSLRSALALSCFVAAIGFLVIALPLGLPGLCLGLVIAGLGSSVQHPRGSLLVTQTYGPAARGPLGIYNFSGDLGKAIFPAAIAALLPVFAWRPAVGCMAVVGCAVGVGLLALIPRQSLLVAATAHPAASAGAHRGFRLLMSIGALDTATRMGYLLFLPFLIHDRGGNTTTVGLGLALLFIGGALGKVTCGWLGQHLGVVGCVIATEAATGLLIVATLFTPLSSLLVILPLLGIVLNGTSSVLYGTVPELAPGGETARAFALFYTAVIGSGAFTPILYGAIADHFGRSLGVLAAAITALLTIPLILILRPALRPLSVGQQ